MVDGESGYLDILLVNYRAQILCAIENKIFSSEGFSEGVSQLTHYRRALEKDLCDFSRRHVSLSPQGVPPQQQHEGEFWTPANYTTIRQLLEQTDANCGDAIREDVRVFLRQYVTTLRRNIVPESQEVQRLVRRIYLENREVINLIHQQSPSGWPKQNRCSRKPSRGKAIGSWTGRMRTTFDSGLLSGNTLR